MLFVKFNIALLLKAFPNTIHKKSVYATDDTEYKGHPRWVDATTILEMETAGYYAMSRLLGHEIISLNAIIANRIRNRFSKDPNKVIDALIKKVLDKIVSASD